MTAPLDLELPALIVLVGASGAGKSTAARVWPATQVLELDQLRAIVSDDSGDQESTPDALKVFRPALQARLRRRRPTVVDATNTERAVRAGLIHRAHAHQLPAVAIVLRTPLETCQSRQQDRAPSRQVPTPTIARQHEGTVTPEQLLAEGFDRAHYADELDLLGTLLQRSAAAGADPLADVRYTFGDALASVFARRGNVGIFAVAGREATVRWCDDGDPYDHHWQARLEDACAACQGALWVKVTSPAELLDVYNGHVPDDEFCDRCDASV